MEGLEIAEINFSEIINTELIRLESEFYTASTFAMASSFLGEEIIDFVQYGTSKELNEEEIGYPVLRLNEFDSQFISKPSKYCSIIGKDNFQSLKLLKDDVLICRTNGNPKYVGKSAIVPNNYEYAYASYLFKIRPKKELINSSTLVTFLNSKYGRMEIEKYSMASNQVNFSPAKFRQLRIPKFNIDFNSIVEKLTYEAFDNLKEAQLLYNQAENLLLESLGLKDFKPSEETVNIKSYKESYLLTGRLDAEYYQPKYDDYFSIIKNHKNGFEMLSEICNLKDKNYKPDDKTTFKYIELSNIGKSGDIKGCTNAIGEELPSRARRLVQDKDVIISSIEGSLDSCALITKEYDNSVCSTGFYVINSEEINSETLVVLFKSELMQNILKQHCSGTILTAINKDEFLNIPIPVIEREIQTQISEKIEESFRLKKQSEQLLELAKKAVEMAIEESEEVAMEFIEEITKKLNITL